MRTELTADVVLTVPGDFATPQIAVDSLRDNYDLRGHIATVNAAPGSYGPLVVCGPFTGQAARSSVTLRGNNANPFLTGFLAGDGFNAITVMDQAQITLEGFHATSVGSGFYGRGVICYGGGRVNLGWWGHHICTKSHMLAGGGGTINCYGTHQLSADSEVFAISEDMGKLYVKADVHIYGNLNFSQAFAIADRGGLTDFANTTFSPINGATVTGVKWNANTNGMIVGSFSNGIPGSLPGVTATGGIYI